MQFIVFPDSPKKGAVSHAGTILHLQYQFWDTAKLYIQINEKSSHFKYPLETFNIRSLTELKEP